MPSTRQSAAFRSSPSAISSGSGSVSSVKKCPNSDSSSSPTGFSSDTGACEVRRICSTSSSGRSTSLAISTGDGSRQSSPRSLRSDRTILLSFSTTWTGIRIVRPLSASARATACRNPPGRVRRELCSPCASRLVGPSSTVELLGGANEANRSFLDQVEEWEPLVAVALRDRDDETEVRLHHLLLRTVVAALDPLRELDLLSGRQQLNLAD